MKVLKEIRSSFYDPAFYAQACKGTVESALKPFSLLVAFGIFAFFVFIFFSLLPFLSPSFYMKFVDAYPDDLVVTIKDGTLSINQPEPYFIKNPFPSADAPKNLVTIDTTSTLQSGDFQKFSTFAIIKSNFAVMDTDSNNRTISFDRIATTTTISKPLITNFVNNLPRKLPYIIGGAAAVGFFVGALVLSFFVVAFYLVYFLLMALLIQIIVRSRGVILTYKEGYITAIYASIPVLLISALLIALSVPRPAFTFSVGLLLIALINTQKGFAETDYASLSGTGK